MLTVRKAASRGHTDLGWLKSYHTFSFGGYNDPAHMGFRSLRVMNEDMVAPGQGFGAHGHRDMEILTYVIEGTLSHKDSMAEGHTLGPNEIQAMSAGSGVIHSEFNASATESVHLLQIWITPARPDVEPSYQQFAYRASEKRGGLRLLAGPDRDVHPPAAHLHQDARMYAAVMGNSETIAYAIAPGRHSWVQCVAGGLDVNGVTLSAGDGVAVSDEASLTLRAQAPESELLLFDLA